MWGNILNNFLEVAHDPDGTIRLSAITAAGGYAKPNTGIPNTDLSSAAQASLASANTAVQPGMTLSHDLSGTIASPTVAAIQGIPVNGTVPSNDQVLTYNTASGQWIPGTVTSTTVGDATTGSKGILELSGDLSGVASSPTVVNTHLSSALPLNQGGTGQTTQQTALNALSGTQAAGKYLRSDGTNTTLGTIQVSDVPTLNQGTTGNAATATLASTVTTNADLTGPITSSGNATSIASQTGTGNTFVMSASPTLSGTPIAPTATAGTNTTQLATTAFVATAVTGAAAPNATTSVSGIVELSGDLAGTGTVYNAPRVSGINGVSVGGTPSAGQAILATSSSTAAWAQREFNVMAFGAKGDGSTDDTAAINSCLTAAAAANGEVYFPPAPGGCYRTSGITVPGGVNRMYGAADMYRSNGPSPVYLTGSVLAPLNSSVTVLMTIGISGSGSVVNSNPHGLRVEGIGFLGTVPAGTAISGMWGVVVTDTSDVTFMSCRDMFCDPKSSVLGGGPSGGTATGGFVQFLSSASGNGFSENGRVLFCASYGAGTFVYVDGISAGAGGSTDGRIMGCQLNSHYHGIQLGPANAGTGGWAVIECHFSATNAVNHIYYGNAGTPWTLRVEACYFDVVGTNHILANTGRGLQIIGNYFRAGTNTIAINFGSTLATVGRDPAAVITGNTFDLNKSAAVTAFVRFQGFTAANFATGGGGEYRGNLIHNHGTAMPGSWVAQFIGSDNLAISNSSTATLDLAAGPVLSA